MITYKLPIGIRIPDFEEYPSGYDANEINKKRDSAFIIEGYKLAEVQGEKFTHLAEINIDADKIWNLFVSLLDSLISDTAYGIIGFKDEEPIMSNFTQKQRILDIFQTYKFELANDGYLQFGIAYYDESTLNEIYISSFKYFQIWTTKKKELVETLDKFRLSEQENLNFVDEFPVVSEALSADKISGVHHHSEVIREIEKEFAAL